MSLTLICTGDKTDNSYSVTSYRMSTECFLFESMQRYFKAELLSVPWNRLGNRGARKLREILKGQTASPELTPRKTSFLTELSFSLENHVKPECCYVRLTEKGKTNIVRNYLLLWAINFFIVGLFFKLFIFVVFCVSRVRNILQCTILNSEKALPFCAIPEFQNEAVSTLKA